MASTGSSPVLSTSTTPAIPVSGAGTSSRTYRNALGSRTDVAWKHGSSVDGGTNKIKCKYCQKIIQGGVYRMKHHLACTQKDVGICKYVPEAIKKEMWDIVCGLQKRLMKKSSIDDEDEVVEVGEKRSHNEDSGSSRNIFKKRGVSSQPTINNIFKKGLRDEACQKIASFFYNNAIPFNVAHSVEFQEMFEMVARHGIGFKPPSYYEIREKYLKKQYLETMQSIEKHKAYWKDMGCTIMTDGWTDKRRRTLINFLVNSPKGTVFLKSIDASHITKTAEKIFHMIDEVVEEVGEESVVQIVTDNATNYKAAGSLLMGRRERLYWTPCAAHCIDLMLEDFEKKLQVHHETIAKGRKITTYIYSRTSLISMLQFHTNGKDLVRPGKTRFATSYLTLGCLNDNKGALIRMFTSDQWISSMFAKTNDGKYIEDVVMDREFWKNVVTCLKGAFPLIKVLRLVDSDEKPAMGFIYDEMIKAREKIQKAFNDVERSYQPLCDIIDARWDNQLMRPLHAAGYFLNPQIQYRPGFHADCEVKNGLYQCLERLVGSAEKRRKIDDQMDDFKLQLGRFGCELAQGGIYSKSPTQWWESYGFEHPELQSFAMCILSLTCSSSGCERNWSTFEMVHSKRRNRLKQKTMNDVVFVMTNSKLARKKQVRKIVEYNIDDVSSEDEWIVENEGTSSNVEGLDEDNLDLELDVLIDEDLAQVGGHDDIGVAGASIDDMVIPDFEFDNEVDGRGREDDMPMRRDIVEDRMEHNVFDDNDLNDLLA